MITRLIKFYTNEEIEPRLRMLRLAGLYTILFLMLTIPCFMFLGYDSTIYYVVLLSIVMLLVIFGIFVYSRDITISSIVFCYLMNIIILPLIYLYGGGMYGGVEVVFVCGIVDGLFLLTGFVRIASEILFFVWYLLIMIYSAYHTEIMHNTPHGAKAVFSMVICLLFSTLVIIIVMEYEGYLLKVKQRKVSLAVRESRNSADTKSRFLTNVSHELRTPMNAVLGMSEIIQNSDNDGRLTEEVSIITQNARDLLSTINSILDFSKLESGKYSMSYDQFDMDTLMRELVNEASIRAYEKGIEFFVSIDPSSPNILYGDHIQIEMILQDLLHDAINSVSDGRVFFKIYGEFSKDRSKAIYHAQIYDTGSGIPEKEMETIYSSFETYDSRQDSRIKRLGLKYSVFKGMLQLMNGSFNLKSLEHIGTLIDVKFETFCVDKVVIADSKYTTGKKVLVYAYAEKGMAYIEEALGMFNTLVDVTYMPEDFTKMLGTGRYDYILVSDTGYQDVAELLGECEKASVFVITDRLSSPADFDFYRIIRRPISSLNLSDIFFERWEDMDYEGAEYLEGFTAPDASVLVVDDNKVNLKVAESLLSRYDMLVKTTESGFGAIEMLKGQSFDLVLMDQMMPGMDGYEALRLIRNNLAIRGARRIPIICMTADSGGDVREKAMKAGFNEYLMKPVKEMELERILITFLPDEKIKRSLAGGTASTE
jgi:signal transduction histidine kinase/CheY-like chemotaxis protein